MAGKLTTADVLLAESYREPVSFESGIKQPKSRRISEIGWQRDVVVVVVVVVVVDRFYIALFSVLEQTHCARM